MPAKPPRVMSRTAVADAIRHGIRGGELAPGQRLVEAELCKAFGTTRGVVRTALTELVHEGLVEHIANRGARVRVVDLPEALQIAEVRMALESLCAARAAERISEAQIAQLCQLGRKLSEHAHSGDTTAYAELTHQLFEIYVRIAEQPAAQEILTRLRARNIRHRFRLTYRPGRPKIALPYWLALIDALCRRDPEAARLAVQRHAANVREAMTALGAEQNLFPALY